MSETLQEIAQVQKALKQFKFSPQRQLLREQHLKYLTQSLTNLGKSIMGYQYGHPWIYFYLVHSTMLLGVPIPKSIAAQIKTALKYCWNEQTGGFGGGYKQLPHLAPTYAAFLCILDLGESAYDLLDRDGLTKFFWSCKKGGKFQMTQGAQEDNRGAYIVAIIVKLLKLDEKLLQGTVEEIVKTQTHEGGLSNVRGGQAHGGYTFCGVAALATMNRLQDLDVSRLLFWMSRRQCEFGGFNGRTNKLLDSCYSFWIGSLFKIINNYFGHKFNFEGQMLYSEFQLQRYILSYCQNPDGGLWDKPGKKRDLYHTCYATSGFSLSSELKSLSEKNIVNDIDPIYNVEKDTMEDARKYFEKNL